MIKYFIVIFTFITSFVVSAQTSLKKEYYLDENNKPVSLVVFKNKFSDYKKYAYTVVSETDSTLTSKIIFREQIGILQPGEHDAVIKALQQLTGKATNAQQTIIVNFFYREPIKNQVPCIDHYTSDKKYRHYINKHDDFNQLFITEKGFSYNQEAVYEDVNETIRNLLFKDVVHCGNYIIIKPSGHYYKKVGEYRQDEIPDKIKEDW